MAHPRRDLFSMKLRRLSRRCQALGYPARLFILAQLSEKDMYVRDLVKQTSLSQSAVSWHLKTLINAGLIKVEEHGLYNKYNLDLEELECLYENLGNFISSLKQVKGNRESGPDDTPSARESEGA